jgi:hypothetical protein
MCYVILLHVVSSTLCVVISIKFLCICFLKFVAHKMNSKMVKSRMMVLTEREKADVVDADMAVGWML